MKTLQNFIIKEVKRLELTKKDVMQLFDNVISSLPNISSTTVICPFCASHADYLVSATARVSPIKCVSCKKKSVVSFGKVRTSKTAENSGISIRFIDSCDRQRYVDLRGMYLNRAELKSKDDFSVCISISPTPKSPRKGFATVLNQTVGQVFSYEIEYTEKSIQDLEGL